MNLLEFRTYFRTNSGRFDLVDVVGNSTGLDSYIQQAQNYLDRLADLSMLDAKAYVSVATGDSNVAIPKIKSIKRINIVAVTGKSTPMVFYIPTDIGLIQRLGIQSLLNAEYIGDTLTGIPKIYSVRSPRILSDDSKGTGIIRGGVLNTSAEINKIYFLPHADKDYTLEVIGQFYSSDLLLSTDVSYWSMAQPNLLYMSVMRQLEIIHRNSAGVSDWENAIKTEIVGIDMDGVAQTLTGDSEMELE